MKDAFKFCIRDSILQRIRIESIRIQRVYESIRESIPVESIRWFGIRLPMVWHRAFGGHRRWIDDVSIASAFSWMRVVFLLSRRVPLWGTVVIAKREGVTRSMNAR
jgi:hypothetical protein